MTSRLVTRSYLPAAGHNWALPFYDPIARLLGVDTARNALLEPAGIQPLHRILDIGCGTGSLAISVKTRYPGAKVVGLDPDPVALGRASHKAAQSSVSIQFDQGFSDALPYPPAAFDRVFSSFMFHHLPVDARETMLREVRRVLAPGGVFLLLDFERREDHQGGFLGRLLQSSHRLKDNSQGRILELMRQAGLVDATKVRHRTLLLGRLHVGYYTASAPREPRRNPDRETAAG